jgi:hypothetical protein
VIAIIVNFHRILTSARSAKASWNEWAIKIFKASHTLFNGLLLLVSLKIWLYLGFPIDFHVLGALLGGFVIGTALNPDVDLNLRWLGFKHRGLTHTGLGAGLAVIAFYFLAPVEYQPLAIVAGLGFGAAWVGHIIGDWISDMAGGLCMDWALRLGIIAAIGLLGLDILGIINIEQIMGGQTPYFH